MVLVYAYFFSDVFAFDMSLLLLTVTLRGVSNKHCLLSLFSLFLRKYKARFFSTSHICQDAYHLHRQCIVDGGSYLVIE